MRTASVLAAGLAWLAGGAAPLAQGAEPSDAVRLGYRAYHAHCYRCHGVDAVAGVLAPDLRRSVAWLDGETFATAVTVGLPSRGMPGFGRLLAADDVAAIREYLIGRSIGAVGPGRPGEP